jgi:hypothetical protein
VVEHLTQLAARRMGKRGLALGFESWASAYIERERRNRVLRLAGAKLTRPKLVACYGHWRRDWFVDSAQEATMSLRERLKLQTARLAEAEARLTDARYQAEVLEARTQVVAAREADGPFRTLDDLAARAGAGRPALEQLAWSGACDALVLAEQAIAPRAARRRHRQS